MIHDAADIVITEIEYNNRTFYKSTFMGIDVVKTNDDFYNVTRIVKDNGYSDFNQINRLKLYKDYKDNLIKTCRINNKTNKIEKLYKSSDFFEVSTNPQKMRSRETLENYREIQETDLSFEIKSQYSNPWMNGTYVHKLLFERVLHHVDVDYALTIAVIVSNIDEEIRLRNITLEQKISEQTDKITQLETNYNNSNKVKLHDKKSSVVISKSNRGSQNCYLINFKEADVSGNPMYKDDIVIGSVFNKSDLQNLFVFYVKTGEIDFIKLINGMMYEIYDMKKVTDFIQDLHDSKFDKKFDWSNILDKFIDKQYEDSEQFRGHLFEFYCWKTFGTPIFKYERSENIALPKADKGIDLLSIPDKTIAQCKFYHKTALNNYRLRTFIDFCSDDFFADWTKVLYVNDGATVLPEVMANNFDVVFIKENDITSFINPIVETLNKRREEGLQIKTDGKTILSLDMNPALHKEISDYISNKLSQNKFIPLADMVADINKAFPLHKEMTQKMFYQLFENSYRKTKTGAITRDAKGTKILIKPVDYEEERKFVNDTIGYGEYLPDEMLKLHNEKFQTEYTLYTFTRRFADMLEHENKKQRSILKKQVNGKQTSIFNLIKSDRLEVYKQFITSETTYEQFNKHFHRYENATSFGIILNKIRESDYIEFIRSHECNDESRLLFNRTFNKRYDLSHYQKMYNDLHQ